MIINKPNSMSVREWLVKKLSLDLYTSEKTIEAIVSHQFDSALNATYKVNTVEISGFGKFVFNTNKAKGMLYKYSNMKNFYEEKLKDESLSVRNREKYTSMLNTVEANIKFLEFKTNENK